MKQFNLIGITATGKVAKSTKSIISYVDEHRHLSIIELADKVQLTTKKGCYNLVKHANMNEYGTEIEVNGKRMHLRYRNTTVPKFWFW